MEDAKTVSYFEIQSLALFISLDSYCVARLIVPMMLAECDGPDERPNFPN